MTTTKKEYRYDKEQLVKAFRKIGLKEEDVVFSHSNIGFLGYPQGGETPEAICKIILDAFFEVLGPGGTLIVPTFTLSFCKGQPFDPDNTPSTVGIFTEFIRKHLESFRSHDPLFSMSGIGAKASELLSNLPNECFGPDSVWGRLMKADACILNIGIGVGSTFIHYAEQMLNVPYRYKKLFTGEIIEKGKKYKSAVIYFVRDLNYPGAHPTWKNIEKDARTHGMVKAEVVGRGEVNLTRCREMFELCKQGLGKNPSYLVEGLDKKQAKDIAPIEEKLIGLTPESSMTEIIEKLWKLSRDLLSDGYDIALFSLAKVMEMKIHRFPTGMECFTWIIPEKWTCYEAYLETSNGERIFDYKNNLLHCMSYSLPFEGVVTREELFKHLHTHPVIPQAVPYKFSPYERDWGLCCSKTTKDSLSDDKYRVVIKTEFSFGELKVGEIVVPGEVEDSFVLCAHLCHTAMANDDLAGVAVGMEVMRRLQKERGLHYTYRFLILPETIGSIAWLSRNKGLVEKIKGGLFLEMLGVDLPHSLQLSFDGNTQVDKCLLSTLKFFDPEAWVGKFRTVICNDELQFNAPGIRIPMLSLSRVQYPGLETWPYPEYHSEYDNPSTVSMDRLANSAELVLKMLKNFDKNCYVVNNFEGEIFCSRYGIHIDFYTNPRGHKALFTVMHLIDGTKTVADIAEDCSLSFEECTDILSKFEAAELIYYSRAPQQGDKR